MRGAWPGVLAAVLAVSAAAEGPRLPLDDYLAQVRRDNPALQASRAAEEGMVLKSEEAAMVFSPLLKADASWLDSRKEPLTSFDPARTVARNWGLGLSKKWGTGTTVSADYGLAYTHLFPQALVLPPGPFGSMLAGFQSALVPLPSWEAKPSLTVSQSLLRDFMAGLTNSGVNKIRKLAEAGARAERFRANAVLFEAEAAYWGLALARAVVDFKTESAARTGRLRDWTAERAKHNLADDADLLQADAAVKLRGLDLDLAREEAEAAARKLNTARGRDGAEVPEVLDGLEERATALGGAALARRGERLDVQAGRLALEAAQLAAKETFYRSLPDLQVFGTVAYSGRDAEAGGANQEAGSLDWRTYTVGAVFVAPLDFFTLRRVRRGDGLDRTAADGSYRKARLAEAQEWAQLAKRWEAVTGRLAVVREIAALQESRLAAEKARFAQGRITTFQYLTAEEDFSQARVQALRIGFEKVLLDAQARFNNAS
ncbi:MAG: TolC family protein [bacterium]